MIGFQASPFDDLPRCFVEEFDPLTPAAGCCPNRFVFDREGDPETLRHRRPGYRRSCRPLTERNIDLFGSEVFDMETAIRPLNIFTHSSGSSSLGASGRYRNRRRSSRAVGQTFENDFRIPITGRFRVIVNPDVDLILLGEFIDLRKIFELRFDVDDRETAGGGELEMRAVGRANPMACGTTLFSIRSSRKRLNAPFDMLGPTAVAPSRKFLAAEDSKLFTLHLATSLIASSNGKRLNE